MLTLALFTILTTVPVPSVVDVQREVTGVLNRVYGYTLDQNLDGKNDVADVNLLIGQVLSRCGRVQIGVALDRASLTVLSTNHQPIVFPGGMATGRVEIRMSHGTPNFNTDFAPGKITGYGWAAAIGVGYPPSNPPDVTVNVTGGKFDPPVWNCP